MRAKARILRAKARFNPQRRRSPFDPCRYKFQLHLEVSLTPCWLYLTSATHRWVLKPESFPILCFFELGRWSAPLIKWSRRFEQYSHAFQRLFFTEFAIVFTKCLPNVSQMWNTFRCIFGYIFRVKCCHCGSNLGYIFRSNWLLWAHLAPSGQVLGGQGPNGSLNPWFWGPRGLPLGSLSHENSSPFLMKKTVEFVAALRMHFDSENGATWVPKWS